MYHLLVIPDWRGCNKTSKGTLTQAAKVQLRSKIARMTNKLKKPKAEVSIKQKRLANKYSSISFDKAIQVGLGASPNAYLLAWGRVAILVESVRDWLGFDRCHVAPPKKRSQSNC